MKMKNNRPSPDFISAAKRNVLYVTGITPENDPILGGIWSMWHQEGFPIELSCLLATERGFKIDWLEAMADASTSDNLPSLMGELEGLVDPDRLRTLKVGFVHAIKRYGGYDSIVAAKRANAFKYATFVDTVIRSLGLPTQA